MVRSALMLLVAASISVAAHAEQVDALVSVTLDNGYEQRGVLTTERGDAPSVLVLLFPGDPSVLQAEVVDGKLVKSKVRGNPLVRARNLLVRPGVGTVLVDCRSDQVDQCKETYIMSKERFDDVNKLLAQLKRANPNVKKVWIAGHSLGSLASASLARFSAGTFDGAIHASTILSPRASYRSLTGFDFGAATVPQLFIHHGKDPCPGTPLNEVQSVARKYKIPLVVVSEASGTKGGACGAFSEHGFAGAEAVLMKIIADAVDRGVDQFR